MDVSIFNPETQVTHQNLKEDNGNLIWFKLLVKALINMGDYKSAHVELVKILYQSFPEGKQKHILEEFENYKASDALSWYTREDAKLYQMLNSALRRPDIVQLFAFRSYIKDLYNQLEVKWKESRAKYGNETIVLYRGQFIHPQELERLKNSVGDFISMNSFVSTSNRLSDALKFINKPRKQNMERLLLVIKANYETESEPFADIADLSRFREGETLFALGCIFRIKSTTYSKKRQCNIVELNLWNASDNRLTITLEKKYYVQDETNLLTLGSIFQKMGKFDLARLYFNKLAEQLHDDDPMRADCFDGLGHTADSQGEYEEALKEHKKALAIREKTGPQPNNEAVSISYINIANAYEKCEDYENAEKYIKEAMTLINDCASPQDLLLACYVTTGSLYAIKKKYEAAHEQLRKALDIAKRQEPCDDIDLGTIYQNIGRVYYLEGKFKESLESCQEALQIRCKVLPANHPSTGNTYQIIAAAQEGLSNFEEALESYEKARNIYKAGNINSSDMVTNESAITRVSQRWETIV